MKGKTQLVPPATVQMVKIIEDDSQLEMFLGEMNLHEFDFVCFPINDASSESQGSHWSLLVYSKKENKYFYLDSHGRYNLKSGEQVAKNVQVLLKCPKKPSMEIVDCPQQANGWDCGVFVLLFTQVILNRISEGKFNVSDLSESVSQTIASQKRTEIRNQILEKSKKN